jgi:serine/threonine protein kinase
MSDNTQTIDRFLQVTRKSGLVEDDRLDAAVAAWPDRDQPLPAALVEKLVEEGILTQWQIDQLRRGKHKGFTLGKYKLLRLLGAGGMSSVYLAEHATLRNKVAIKVLPRHRVDQTSYLARFEREARTSARLNHPNIVRAFDLDTSGEIHFIAMEYVDGIDLQAKVREDGPLPLREALDYVRQAALGLQHAHEEGLVHRDIKPANLILDGRGTVKILDLGLALAQEEDTSLTKAHDEKVLGTADYLAPEQARDSHAADGRSDIYALGCTLHYLLVGKPPFAEGKLAQRIQAHLRAPPPNLLEARPDVPPAIASLYFQMLEKHPDARPQSARDVADALTAWLAANDAEAAAGRRPPPRRAPPRRSGTETGSPAVDLLPPPAGRAAPGGTSVAGRPGSGIRPPSGPRRPPSGVRPPPVPPPPTAATTVDPDVLSFTPPPSQGTQATVRIAAAPRASARSRPRRGRQAATTGSRRWFGRAAGRGGDEVLEPAEAAGSSLLGVSPRILAGIVAAIVGALVVVAAILFWRPGPSAPPGTEAVPADPVATTPDAGEQGVQSSDAAVPEASSAASESPAPPTAAPPPPPGKARPATPSPLDALPSISQ